MTSKEVSEGDKVTWNWGAGAPGGKVARKKTEGEISIKSHRGNTITKKASPDNPAVHISRSGNDVVKRVSELNAPRKGEGKTGRRGSGSSSSGGSSSKKSGGSAASSKSSGKKGLSRTKNISTNQRRNSSSSDGKGRRRSGSSTASKKSANGDDFFAHLSPITPESSSEASSGDAGSRQARNPPYRKSPERPGARTDAKRNAPSPSSSSDEKSNTKRHRNAPSSSSSSDERSAKRDAITRIAAKPLF